MVTDKELNELEALIKKCTGKDGKLKGGAKKKDLARIEELKVKMSDGKPYEPADETMSDADKALLDSIPPAKINIGMFKGDKAKELKRLQAEDLVSRKRQVEALKVTAKMTPAEIRERSIKGMLTHAQDYPAGTVTQARYELRAIKEKKWFKGMKAPTKKTEYDKIMDG